MTNNMKIFTQFATEHIETKDYGWLHFVSSTRLETDDTPPMMLGAYIAIAHQYESHKPICIQGLEDAVDTLAETGIDYAETEAGIYLVDVMAFVEQQTRKPTPKSTVYLMSNDLYVQLSESFLPRQEHTFENVIRETAHTQGLFFACVTLRQPDGNTK